MPLKPGCGATSENIRELIAAGYPRRQAIAVALSQKRKTCKKRRGLASGSAAVLYHGAKREFKTLKRNGLGILWLAFNPVVAVEYALPSYIKQGYLWTVTLKSDARIVALNDLRQPAIRALFEATNEARRSGLGPWSEADWKNHADFGVFEQFQWASRFLTQRRIDGVLVNDKLSTTDIRHPSIGLFKLNTIASAERREIVRGPAMTIGEIEEAARRWDLENRR